jgi:hypothetical protein
VLTVSLDRLDSPRLNKKDCWSGHWGSSSHANRGEISSPGSSGKIGGSADFSTNLGWMMYCSGQAENLLRGHVDETTLVQTRRIVLESAAPTKSVKSAESVEVLALRLDDLWSRA